MSFVSLFKPWPFRYVAPRGASGIRGGHGRPHSRRRSRPVCLCTSWGGAALTLRTHLAKQAEDRIAAGPAWSDNGLVFASAVGTPLDPSNVRQAFKRLASKAGLSEGFPYLLRHSAGSLRLDGRAFIEQVADILGGNPETLLRYYRHRVRPVADAGLRMQDVLTAKQ